MPYSAPFFLSILQIHSTLTNLIKLFYFYLILVKTPAPKQQDTYNHHNYTCNRAASENICSSQYQQQHYSHTTDNQQNTATPHSYTPAAASVTSLPPTMSKQHSTAPRSAMSSSRSNMGTLSGNNGKFNYFESITADFIFPPGASQSTSHRCRHTNLP
jgi:hypothetical protein